ncbi:nucleotidyltransferase domain-containing protein [Caldivirga sp.]|uniref:nucleotidyltransferase domain-containing protein n=1 Tax=Caldivirga sp. TaxID=2080243 RepID=UPI0025BB5B1A|nr:nucleotidyltransferase domain-containing protein [Caldivirga sp.]
MLPSYLPKNIRETLGEFLRNLCSSLGNDSEVYLFGSFARGDWLMDSDVDLIVVSGRLKGISWYERYPMLRRMAPPNIAIDVFAYTPEEFEAMKSRAFMIDIERYWVKIGCA